MRVEITQKFRLFSHRPGIRCLIPFTTWEAQIFPTKIFFRNLAGGGEKEFDIDGSFSKFTVMQDLERGHVVILGKEKIFLTTESYPFLKRVELPLSKKRLFMGVHKKQDWEMIQRRMDMAEVFPFWMRISQLIPEVPLPEKPIGTMHLLQEGKMGLLFQAGFQGILCPRLRDEHFLGLIPDVEIPKSSCPLGILHEGARQIEALFFHAEGEKWHFLPHLPQEFHAGRFVYLQTPEGDEIDIEWSKKVLKKIIVRPAKTRKVVLVLRRGLKSFRVRTNIRQKGETAVKELHLQAGQMLFLDRFMK